MDLWYFQAIYAIARIAIMLDIDAIGQIICVVYDSGCSNVFAKSFKSAKVVLSSSANSISWNFGIVSL